MALLDPVHSNPKVVADTTFYRVIVRTALAAYACNIPADSSAGAAELAATQFASVACGITVKGEVS